MAFTGVDTSIKIIGEVRSCYIEKWGTPRQSGLAPSSQAELLIFDASKDLLRTFSQAYSHVTILFIFHLDQKTAKARKGSKAKVKPPKLYGKSLGVFATRSPHRPNPIGLSVCKVEGVDMINNKLLLSGVDMIDGTPVLDVSGFNPDRFGVSPNALRVPSWISLPSVVDIPKIPAMSSESTTSKYDEARVYFSLAAFYDVFKHVEKFKPVDAFSMKLFSLIRETLCLDPRSTHSVQRHSSGTFAVLVMKRQVIYQHIGYMKIDGVKPQSDSRSIPLIRVLKVIQNEGVYVGESNETTSTLEEVKRWKVRSKEWLEQVEKLIPSSILHFNETDCN